MDPKLNRKSDILVLNSSDLPPSKLKNINLNKFIMTKIKKFKNPLKEPCPKSNKKSSILIWSHFGLVSNRKLSVVLMVLFQDHGQLPLWLAFYPEESKKAANWHLLWMWTDPLIVGLYVWGLIKRLNAWWDEAVRGPQSRLIASNP